MRPNTLLCAYPWDLADAAAADRAAATGAEGISIATAYHAVRAATPRHRHHRVVTASEAFYLPIRPELWAGERLRPTAPSGAAAGTNALAAARHAQNAGLRTEAWLVLTHRDGIGAQHPGLVLVDAWGDSHDYALCPSAPDVVRYAALVVAESVRLSGICDLMIEACGPMGFGHLGTHDKTQGAEWTACDEALLSLCFCRACRAALSDAGLDVEELTRRVRGAVGTGVPSVEEALGEELAAAVLTVRVQARERLLTAVDREARAAGARRLRYHAQPDPWATGPFAALTGQSLVADGVILPGDLVLTDPEGARAAAAGVPLGAYLSAVPPAVAADVVGRWPSAFDTIDELRVYHLGLLSEARLGAVTRALSARSTY